MKVVFIVCLIAEFCRKDISRKNRQEAMQWANNTGIINGKAGNRLNPQGNATRAEIATMMRGFMIKYR